MTGRTKSCRFRLGQDDIFAMIIGYTSGGAPYAMIRFGVYRYAVQLE